MVEWCRTSHVLGQPCSQLNKHLLLAASGNVELNVHRQLDREYSVKCIWDVFMAIHVSMSDNSLQQAFCDPRVHRVPQEARCGREIEIAMGNVHYQKEGV
ncbi:hypothetical protein PMIN07_008344 [Paraphaeosphaeria minitans]